MDLEDYKTAYDTYYGNKQFQTAPMDTAKVLQRASEVGKAYPSSALESLKAAGLGSLQGIGNLGISAVNFLPQLLGSEKRIPHLNLEKYSNPEYGLEFGAGEFLAPGVGQLGAMQKLNKIARPMGMAGIGSDVARGALLGGILGEDKEGGGRLQSAALGGLLSPGTGMTNKELMRKLGSQESKMAKKFQEGFSNIWKEAAKSGATHVSKTKIPGIINKELAFSHDSANRFRKSPSLENAFKLQSDLGKDMRALESRGLNTFPSEKIRAYNAAKQTQSQLNDAIERSFHKQGRPDLAKNLQELKELYPTERVPWMDADIQDALKMYRKGRKPAGRAVRQISGTGAFKDELSQMLPELLIREKLKKYGKSGAILGTIGLGGGYAAKKGVLELLEALRGE